MKNIFITGKPGSGKTTLIIKIANSKKDKTMGGFYTEEIRVGTTRFREGRDRVGFSVKTLSGEDGILSHVHPVRKKAPPGLSNGVSFKSGPRVGKYWVDIDVIDKLIVNSIEEAIRDKDIIVIDEIGKMEMVSRNFKSAVKNALDSQKIVLATIPVYSNTFLDSLKARNDIEIFNLNVDNRDRLVDEILKKL